MRKLLLCAVALLGMATANAQGLKGTWFATANFGYAQDSEFLGAKGDVTRFVPVVGTFVAPTTAVGLGAGFISVKPERGDSTNFTVVEPLVRQYFPVAGKLYFFGQVATPMVFTDGLSIYGATLTPGLDFVVNSWFTVEFSATMASLQVISPEVGDSSVSFGMNPFAHDLFGTTAQVGFKFLF